jgi:crotonobetainyl-CoA:carnitine CoA-transferase CaiB-like acyl-CoA transferase
MPFIGHPGGLPCRAGGPVVDIGCALSAAYAIPGAYIGRQSSGEGQCPCWRGNALSSMELDT